MVNFKHSRDPFAQAAAPRLPFHEEVDEIVIGWIEANGVEVLVGGTFEWRSENLTAKQLGLEMWRQGLIKGLGKDHYFASLANVTRLVYADALQEAQHRVILAAPVDDIYLRGALRVMVGDEVDPEIFEYYVVAMKQFAWQVKQKLLGRKVKFDIVPLFYSRINGSGKTSFCEHYGRVIGKLFNPGLDAAVFTDSFRRKTLAKYYVGLLDEMVGMGGRDEAAIKRVISADTLNSRGMHSEDEREFKRNISFIGTSNKRLNEDIQDSTGMRRWVEIVCLEEKIVHSPERLKAFQAIQWDRLWNCIGADEESPYGANALLMDKFQSRLLVASDFESFCTNYLIEEEGAILTNKTAFAAYAVFMTQCGKKPGSIQIFAAKMREKFPAKPSHNAVTYVGVSLRDA